MTALRQLLAIVRKDALLEWRSRDLLSTMVVLGFTSIVLFNFALDFGRIPFARLGAPVLWMAFLFTGVTGIARTFGVERENACLEGLLLAPADRSVVYLAKLVVNVVVLLALLALLVGASWLLLNHGAGRVSLPLARWGALAAVLALHAFGFAAVGTLFGLMAQRTKRGDVLLAVVQAILTLPVLVPAVLATQRVLAVDAPLDGVGPLLRLAAAFDVVFLCLALVVFDHVVED